MLYPALCLGGTLHVVSERTATDPEAWTAYAERHGIDCLKLVPSHLRLGVYHDPSYRCHGYRCSIGVDNVGIYLAE